MIKKRDAAHLLAGLDLGSAVAESDNLLEAARVETSIFDDLLADRIDLIPGTKGSGKTALYLPNLMLKNKRVIIAHGVRQRQDSVFLAHKKQFEQLSEADFVDFWCIYLMSYHWLTSSLFALTTSIAFLQTVPRKYLCFEKPIGRPAFQTLAAERRFSRFLLGLSQF
jgi:hypothetical protein